MSKDSPKMCGMRYAWPPKINLFSIAFTHSSSVLPSHFPNMYHPAPLSVHVFLFRTCIIQNVNAVKRMLQLLLKGVFHVYFCFFSNCIHLLQVWLRHSFFFWLHSHCCSQTCSILAWEKNSHVVCILYTYTIIPMSDKRWTCTKLASSFYSHLKNPTCHCSHKVVVPVIHWL